jgi:hypothetical protein
MTHYIKPTTSFVLAAAVGAVVLFGNDNMRTSSDPWIATAEAIIGRPLTPLSYAGVARRTTRRAVVAGAAVGAAAAAPVYAAPVYVAPTAACVQVVNSYGQLYWRCP